MRRVVPVVIVVVLLAAIAAAAYFQEAVGAFVNQQGWNPAASVDVVKEFLADAGQPGKGKAAADLLDSTVLTGMLKGDRLDAVRLGATGMASVIPIRKLAPSSTVKSTQTDLLTDNGGAFRVLVQYDNGKWGEYRVRRKDGVRKIFQVPSTLSDSPPARGKFE